MNSELQDIFFRIVRYELRIARKMSELSSSNVFDFAKSLLNICAFDIFVLIRPTDLTFSSTFRMEKLLFSSHPPLCPLVCPLDISIN